MSSSHDTTKDTHVEHTCTTADGVRIAVGLVVINNDLKPVKVVREPRLYGAACDGEGHGATNLPGECWWDCERPDGTRAGSFDGSRMTTSYYFPRRARKVTAQELWDETTS
jgi:hypothetical protein